MNLFFEINQPKTAITTTTHRKQFSSSHPTTPPLPAPHTYTHIYIYTPTHSSIHPFTIEYLNVKCCKSFKHKHTYVNLVHSQNEHKSYMHTYINMLNSSFQLIFIGTHLLQFISNFVNVLRYVSLKTQARIAIYKKFHYKKYEEDRDEGEKNYCHGCRVWVHSCVFVSVWQKVIHCHIDMLSNTVLVPSQDTRAMKTYK